MYHQFAPRLQLARRERHLRQRDVERALNLGPGTLSQYERGLREPGFQLLLSLADYFEVSIDWLLGRPEAVRESPALGAARRRLQARLRERPLRGARPRDRVLAILEAATSASPELFATERMASRLGLSADEFRRLLSGPAVLKRLEEYLGVSLTG